MVKEARGVVKLAPIPEYRQALNHLDTFSHIWLVFEFQTDGPWRPTIRPPRVDGPRRVGVFASRSPHRPNPIGISVVGLDSIDFNAPGGIEIFVHGVDLLDQTPILDIKPYLPFADSIPHANPGWAHTEIPSFEVLFSDDAEAQIKRLSSQRYPRLHALITQTLEWDPRPTSQRRAMPIQSAHSDGKVFGFRLLDLDIQWQITEGRIRVISVVEVPTASAPSPSDLTSGSIVARRSGQISTPL